jgi:hypothetical protein
MITSPKLQQPSPPLPLSVGYCGVCGHCLHSGRGKNSLYMEYSKHDQTVRRNAFVFFQFREITLKDAFLHPETEDCTRGFAYSWHSRQRYQASILIYIIFKLKMPINIRAVLLGRIRIHMDPQLKIIVPDPTSAAFMYILIADLSRPVLWSRNISFG